MIKKDTRVYFTWIYKNVDYEVRKLKFVEKFSYNNFISIMMRLNGYIKALIFNIYRINVRFSCNFSCCML